MRFRAWPHHVSGRDPLGVGAAIWDGRPGGRYHIGMCASACSRRPWCAAVRLWQGLWCDPG